MSSQVLQLSEVLVQATACRVLQLSMVGVDMQARRELAELLLDPEKAPGIEEVVIVSDPMLQEWGFKMPMTATSNEHLKIEDILHSDNIIIKMQWWLAMLKYNQVLQEWTIPQVHNVIPAQLEQGLAQCMRHNGTT